MCRGVSCVLTLVPKACSLCWSATCGSLHIAALLSTASRKHCFFSPASLTRYCFPAPLASPQTEAELQGLDAAEVERLADEAAELQARAATALRLAQRRLQVAAPAAAPAAGSEGPSVSSVIADESGAAMGSTASTAAGAAADGVPEDGGDSNEAPLERSTPSTTSLQPAPPAAALGGGPAAAATAAAAPEVLPSPAAPSSGAEAAAALPQPPLPPAALHVLQLFILLLAAGEALLLWTAQAVQAGSCGLLRVPRSLALAPLAPARAALPVLLLSADACLVLLALLRGQRWAAAGL